MYFDIQNVYLCNNSVIQSMFDWIASRDLLAQTFYIIRARLKEEIMCGMGMSMNFRQSVGQCEEMLVQMKMRAYCEICNSEIVADDSGELVYTCAFPCPSKILNELNTFTRTKTIRHGCPECYKEDVGLNSSDFYECRSCNTQFTICGSEEWRRTYLIDEKKMDDAFEAIIPVRVMPELGQGDFPAEEWISKRIRKVEKAKKKLITVLRSMRKYLGERKIFFNGYEFTPDVGELAHCVLTKQGILYY